MILFTAAYSVVGRPAYTAECGNCHTTTPSPLVISSNATGTVNAAVGTPFTLIVDASGSTSNKDGDFAVSVQAGWADNDQFSFTPHAVLDQAGDDLNLVQKQIQASFTFTPLAAGSWTLRIWSAAKGGLSKSLDVSVSAVVSDTTPPTIDSPNDKSISEGQAANVTWNPSDANPDRYVIFDDESSWLSGPWDGSAILAPLQTLSLGTHNITLAVFDVNNNWASDQVNVTVYDGTAPTIDTPDDVLYNETQIGYTISWNPADLHPASYEIYRNTTPVRSGLWNSSVETISISVDGLLVGAYNYTIVVTDVGGNSIRNEVNVIVSDGTPPTIDNPSDIDYNEGQIGNSITWNPSDAYPVGYTIYRDNTPIKSGPWNSTSESISISVDGLSPGTYSFRLEVTDIGGNTATHTVVVTVNDITPPTINDVSNFSYAEYSTGNNITWSPNDLHPVSYIIYRNGVHIKSGLWNSSSELIVLTIDGLPLNVYVFTILVFDIGLNNATDSVTVTVYDGTAPTIDRPIDTSYPEGVDGNSVDWTPFDYHPSNYTIYMNEVAMRSGSWNSSSEVISVLMDGLALGEYNFTIIVFDNAGLSVVDQVLITIFDGTDPTTTHPDDVFYPDGQIGDTITWQMFDLHPVSYIIKKDNVTILSGLWNSTGETITINVEGLVIGEYNYTILVTDIGGNTALDWVLVTVYNAEVPTINEPQDKNIAEFSTNNTIQWHPLDLNPSNYSVYRNGQLVRAGLWNSSAELITVSIDGLSIGGYTFFVVVQDLDGNTANDTVLVTVFDGTNPVLDSPDDVTYNEFDLGATITWNATDSHPVSYSIYRNDTMLPIQSGPWNATSELISISVQGLSFGVYNYTIIITDMGGNSAKDMVLVFVEDGTPPVIDLQLDIQYNETTGGAIINWTASDLHPYYYSIYKDGNLAKSGLWNSSSEIISISVAGLPAGVFVYTLEVMDLGGNVNSSQVTISVNDVTKPILNHPGDVTLNEGENGGTISWTPFDLHPASYIIYRNGNLVRIGAWNTSADVISISLGFLQYGWYNYTIVVQDESSNIANDSIYVIVKDNIAPLLESQNDIVLSEGTIGEVITWNASDTNPYLYQVFRDGVSIISGYWNTSAEPFLVNLDGLGLGVYNYTLLVFDVDLNSANDTVIVTVEDITPPLLNSPSDITFEEGETGLSIEWLAEDLHPASFTVYKGGQQINTDVWFRGSNISVPLDGMLPGSYTFTLFVYDTSSNFAMDQVSVIVTDKDDTTTTTTTTTTSTTTTTTITTTSPTAPRNITQEAAFTIMLSFLVLPASLFLLLIVAEAIVRRRRR